MHAITTNCITTSASYLLVAPLAKRTLPAFSAFATRFSQLFVGLISSHVIRLSSSHPQERQAHSGRTHIHGSIDVDTARPQASSCQCRHPSVAPRWRIEPSCYYYAAHRLASSSRILPSTGCIPVIRFEARLHLVLGSFLPPFTGDEFGFYKLMIYNRVPMVTSPVL